MTKHFEHLFVFGRPAGGKSEFIDYMKHCDPDKRRKLFNIAPFSIIDDYLFIRELAENEDIFEKFGRHRVHTELSGGGIAVTEDAYFEYASEKMNRIVTRDYLSHPEFYNDHTLLLEFSRGVDRVGYRHSLELLKPEILSKGVIIYIKVTFEESVRRNEARYQEKLKYSVLAHKCPEKAMNRFYKNDDWMDLTNKNPTGSIKINGINIPFVTMENEPESKENVVMEKRYSDALGSLFDIWKTK